MRNFGNCGGVNDSVTMGGKCQIVCCDHFRPAGHTRSFFSACFFKFSGFSEDTCEFIDSKKNWIDSQVGVIDEKLSFWDMASDTVNDDSALTQLINLMVQ